MLLMLITDDGLWIVDDSDGGEEWVRSIPRPLYAAGPDDGNVADDVGQRRQQVLAVYRGRQGN